jgi:hypothetical protein
MITVHEARLLAEDSQQRVDEVIQELDGLIREAAKQGQRRLSYQKGRCCWRDDDWKKKQESTPFVNRVTEVLQQHGFRAAIIAGDTYRFGLFGLDEEEHFNYSLEVCW